MQCSPGRSFPRYLDAGDESVFFISWAKQELENWLRYLLSKNADFEFQSVDIEGKHIEILIVSKSIGVPETSAGSISRLIKEVLGKKLIRPLDPSTAPRYMRYIPMWA